MKIRSFFLVFVLLGGTDFTLAQVFVGPVAGGQYSWVALADDGSRNLYRVKPVLGFNGGIAVHFRVRERFSLHTSVLYSTKGKRIAGKDDPLLDQEVTYHFIDMPLVYTVDFKGTTGSGKQFKYAFGIGPNVSYWLGGRGTLWNADFSELTVPAQDYKIVFKQGVNDIAEDQMGVEDPNRIQLGLNVTAGLTLEPSPDQKFVVTLRYEFGHSYFSRTSNGVFLRTYYTDDLRSRNQGVRLSVAYLFDLNLEERKKGKSTIKH